MSILGSLMSESSVLMSMPTHNEAGVVSILGYGSLMSESSALMSMPTLQNFRYVRILGHRRVFAHTSPLFHENGIARYETREISSLSAEPSPGSSFCGVAFDILAQDWPAFVAREAEYVLSPSTFVSLDGGEEGSGMLCIRGSDDLIKQRGTWPRYEAMFDASGLEPRTCWDWDVDSGLKPCACYLRHCLLSSQRADVPAVVRESFLSDSFLVDRRTTLREYLRLPGVEARIMASVPPPGLGTRYGG
ncbi:hypothetical protein KFE25_008819 [Diacronema lutheri]|uniref:Gamma-glutamylcyclotransferase n=1 Tax=Diacronema lutheri TaxID=2081491 RepID=A0A8J5XRJ2_DIALT|nr:hypothetical protein KFE25_008819 [Diacronema lutheri]